MGLDGVLNTEWHGNFASCKTQLQNKEDLLPLSVKEKRLEDVVGQNKQKQNFPLNCEM